MYVDANAINRAANHNSKNLKTTDQNVTILTLWCFWHNTIILEWKVDVEKREGGLMRRTHTRRKTTEEQHYILEMRHRFNYLFLRYNLLLYCACLAIQRGVFCFNSESLKNSYTIHQSFCWIFWEIAEVLGVTACDLRRGQQSAIDQPLIDVVNPNLFWIVDDLNKPSTQASHTKFDESPVHQRLLIEIGSSCLFSSQICQDNVTGLSLLWEYPHRTWH